MIEANTKSMGRQFSSNKSITLAIILVVLIAFGLYSYNAYRAFQSTAPKIGTVMISQSALEENYGLHVQLVAVTAEGGLIDIRFRIVDAEKAKALLEDRANFPALRVGNGVILQASEDVARQPIQFENGRSLFVLFPNAGNILKPGDPVNIVLGDLQVEAIQSK